MSVPEPHFRRVMLRQGYDIAQVDAFITRLQATVDGRAGDSPVTAEDVRDVRFRSVRLGGGYDVEQVDHFLEQVQALLGPAR